MSDAGIQRLSDILPAGMGGDDLAVLLAGATAFLTVLAVGSAMTERDRLGPRLRAIAERRAQLKGEAIAPRRRGRQEGVDWMRRIVNAFHLLKKNQTARLAETLAQAGYRSKDALVVFAFFKLIGPLLGLAFAVTAVGADVLTTFEFSARLAALPGGLYLGMKLPDMYVRNARAKRWHRVRQGLPDGLDLMLICAEAGLTLGAALDRVSREIGSAYPELGDELSLTSIELGFLPERRMALDHLASRVDIQEVRGIVSVLLQTEKYGTPIAQALRALTQEFRTQRMLRAEYKAARLPALMTVPMILFILPCLFIVLLSPAMLTLLSSMK